MNLGEIRRDVRSLIIEPTPGFRSNLEINRWINQAHQELGMLYRLETAKDINLTPGVSFYKLPDDLLTFKGAWDEHGNSVPTIPVVSGSDLPRKTDTVSFTIFRYGEIFVIVPPPENVTNIKLFYERTPKLLNNDDAEPEIPTPYHKYLVSYATMRAFDKDDDFEASDVYLREYEEGKQLIATHKTPLSQDANAVLNLLNYDILNPAEAAEWLNIPLKDKVHQRVEVESKALQLLSAGVISREDLIERTVFPDKSDIEDRLVTTASELIPLPSWDDDISGDSNGE